jgi:hypothetical protein
MINLRRFVRWEWLTMRPREGAVPGHHPLNAGQKNLHVRAATPPERPAKND